MRFSLDLVLEGYEKMLKKHEKNYILNMLVTQEIIRSNPGRIIAACSVDNGWAVYVAVAAT